VLRTFGFWLQVFEVAVPAESPLVGDQVMQGNEVDRNPEKGARNSSRPGVRESDSCNLTENVDAHGSAIPI
jgi:hypothetical protein